MSMSSERFNRPALVAMLSLFLASNSGCSEPVSEKSKATAPDPAPAKTAATSVKPGKTKGKIQSQVTSRRDREAGRRRGDPSVE